MNTDIYQQYLTVLREELVPALGCTEPIAIAYAAALATRTLGRLPERMRAACSGNIVKNVKGVVVPHSGGQKGIEAAAAIGAVGGDPDKKLEVLCGVLPEQIEQAKTLVDEGFCQIELLTGVTNLHIIITAMAGDDNAVVEIAKSHTNIVRIEKNGHIIMGGPYSPNTNNEDHSRDFMSVAGILEFAESCDLADVQDILEQQIEYNTHIADEGLAHAYGANVGKSLLASRGNDVRTRAKARAAAGSDARMGGCELPVVINSGSGNQGMTVSLPVIEYARELNLPKTTLHRALLVSNLVAIHQKTRIGKLSAYCGAVSAACGGGAGITYLCGGDLDQIASTITNTLANVSGIVCDGAKPSCAAKIASSVDAAIMAHDMAMHSSTFPAGEGIVKENVEATIRSVGRLAKKGMRSTDEEVLHIMIDD